MQKIQMLLRPNEIRKQVVIVLAYSLFYIVLLILTGPSAISLAIIPVAASGWFFGPAAGLIAGVIAFALNATFFYYWMDGTQGLFLLATGWPAHLIILGMGYSLGLLQQKTARQNKRIGDDLQSRERFIALMSIATKNIYAPKEPDEKYYYLANNMANLFVADYAYILAWDKNQNKMNFLVSTRTIENPFTNISLSPGAATPNTFLLTGRQALLIDTKTNSPHIVDISAATSISIPANSELAIPLISGEYRFGVVVHGYNTKHDFFRDELLFAQLAAAQMSLALWTSEQDAIISKQLAEAKLLKKVSDSLIKLENLGVETVLKYIVDAVRELIPTAQQVVLHMLDEEKNRLTPGAISGARQLPTGRLYFNVGQGVAGHVALTGKTLNVPDVTNEPLFSYSGTSAPYRSLVVAPIRGKERMFGTISVDSKDINAFGASDCQLLEAFCAQAAIAIENAILIEKQQEDFREISILYRVTSGLTASIDYTQLLREVTDLVWKEFKFYHVQVFVAEPESGDLVMLHASGTNAAHFLSQGHRLAIGDGIVGHVAETGEPFVTNNVEDIIFFKRHPSLSKTQSELCAPVKIDNQVLGVLDIQEAPPRRFTQRHMKLITAIADQLAVSLQKARLYEELQDSLQKEKETRAQLIRSEQLAVIGRLLASVSHELNNPIQAIQNSLFLLKSEEQLSEQGRQDLELILSETERMASLLGRLRDTYRSTSTDDFKNMQPNTAVEEVFSFTGTYMRHKGITFVFHPNPNIPHVHAIKEQINQVILNILLNAIDAMPIGGQITATTDYLAEREQVLIKFSDTGAGIADDILPNIFDAFVTNKNSGSGLGLAISQEIIQRHNGQICAENNPGKGATFSIWLPANKGPNP